MTHALHEATLLDELLASEYTYLSHLDAISLYKDPFPLAAEVSVVFGNWEAVRELHENLSTQLGAATELTTVAEVFLRFGPQLRLVYLKYCGNSERSLQRLRELDKELAPFLASQKSASNGASDLRSLLKEPTQRPSHYAQLLRAMIAASSDASSQSRLSDALAEVEKVVGLIRETSPEAEKELHLLFARHKVTADEQRQLAESGVLSVGALCKLDPVFLEGTALRMTPTSALSRHQCNRVFAEWTEPHAHTHTHTQHTHTHNTHTRTHNTYQYIYVSIRGL
jgi:hypothetical protein